MELSRILTSLHNYSRKWVQSFDRDYDILSLSLLNGTDVSDFEPHILYYGTCSQLLSYFPDGGFRLDSIPKKITFLCIEDRPFVIPKSLQNATGGAAVSSSVGADRDSEEEPLLPVNLITLESEADYSDVLSILLDLFGNAAKVSGGRSKLIDKLHSNQGLQAIVDEASDILKNPVIVVDSSYKILAMTSEEFGDDDRKDLEEQRSLGFMLKANIDAMNRARLYEQAREEGRPIYNKSPDAAHGWITALLYIHGIEIGQIGVMDSHHPFTDSDYEIIDFLCKILSVELQKSDFYRTNQGLMHSYFLSDLLDNQLQDETMIAERVSALGWNFGDSLRIMLLSDQKQNFFEGKAQLITRQLQSLLPDSRWVIYHGQIVFLLNAPETPDEKKDAALAEYLKINQLSAAISQPFRNLMDIRRHYDQAQIADRYGHRLHSEDSIHLYSNYVFYHMADLVQDRNALINFYHPGVVALREYDKQHKTVFLETLKLYLAYIDQPDLIAEKLFIHKNTVFYRIGKIKEQFHLNLNDGEERFRIHMTIKLMELEG